MRYVTNAMGTRKEPDRVTCSSGGVGSPQHLAAEMFNAGAGVKLAHIPYKGASQATLAVASGEVQVMPVALSLALPFLADKRVRLRIRTLDSAIYRESPGALGFQPLSIDVKDLVRVVKTREVDAQENRLTNFVNFELFKHHPYLSLSGHFFGVLVLVCNQHWFASLTGTAQQALPEGARHATMVQREKAANEDARLLHQLHTQDIQIVEPSGLDLDAMKQVTRLIVAREARSLAPQIVSAYLDEVMR